MSLETATGNFTKPIVTSGGFNTKLNDMKIEDIEIDKDAQQKMIEFERERQFTRFSTLYYKEFIIVQKLMKNKSTIIVCGDPKHL